MRRSRYIGRSDPKTEATDYKTIDGNYARAVIGYCQYHQGYVTARQAKVHRCHLKHGGVCPRLQDMEGKCVRKVKTEVFYDKMLDRMDKMITAMNKLTRTIEAVEKADAIRNTMMMEMHDTHEYTVPMHFSTGGKVNNYADQLNEMDQDIE